MNRLLKTTYTSLGFSLGISTGLYISTTINASPDGTKFIANACTNVMDAVVNISVHTPSRSRIFNSQLVSTGSGFFIHSNGTILTNAHVVSDLDSTSKLVVTLSNGLKLSGYVHAIDVLSDLAVVQIPTDQLPPGIKPVTFGKDGGTRVGEFVACIGSPYGLQNTVTAGIVSSKRWSSDIGGLDSRVEYIQTDCSVHSGSSGGPLINMNGHVIGINTVRAESDGITFAIRVDKALAMVRQLVKEGRVIRPYLGIKMTTLSPFVWQQLKLNPSGTKHLPKVKAGILVTDVLDKSPAMEAGFMQGDIIVGVNGVSVASSLDLYKLVGIVNEEVGITLKRNYPLEQDWDGRVVRYETIEETIKVTPKELDFFIQTEKGSVAL